MRYQTILLLCLVAACKPKTNAQTLLQPNTDSSLTIAYQQHSFTALQTFFDSWAQETPPVTAAQLDSMPEAVQHVYAIFKTFYRPHEIYSMGGSEWGDSLYKNTRYFILQNKIYYTVDGKKDSILRFHPQLADTALHALILTARYNTMLNHFLGDQHTPLGAGNIMTPAAAAQESALHQQFLNHFVNVWYGHWGGYWQLYSYPVIDSITFEKNFTSATAYFRMVYEGGEAHFERVGKEWRLVKAQRTWIE